MEHETLFIVLYFGGGMIAVGMAIHLVMRWLEG